MAVRQEVNKIERLLVVQDKELAMKRALYGCLCNFGIQYMIGSLSSFSSTRTLKLEILDI
jgi:hypothetical protein